MEIAESLSGYLPIDCGIQTAVDSLRERVASAAFKAASYLTDPICKGHEYFRRLYLVDSLNEQSYWISNLARKALLMTALVGCVSMSTLTTLPGIVLRSFASSIQKQPYVSVVDGEGRELGADRSFSLLSWNVCGVSAGYAISDGGVMPIAFRMDRILNKIIEKDADVNCCYEVFDVNTGYSMAEKLKQHGYTDFYFHFGSRGVGVSSGIFVASKYRIANPEFTPFSQDMLIGRTKNCAKGVFGFDLESKGNRFARIFATHLQHSEAPEFPTPEEVEARKRQMCLIADKVSAVGNRTVLVTGDLNLDDREYELSNWKDRFVKGDEFQVKTWGGDGFCAAIVGKPISQGLNLDHTMAAKGSIRSIQTTIVETGFDGTVFKEEALSDHSGLFSRVCVR